MASKKEKPLNERRVCMPTVTTYDRRGKKVLLQTTGKKGMYERLDANGKGTGNIVNLKTALQCESLFTEEQHQQYLEKKAKRRAI